MRPPRRSRRRDAARWPVRSSKKMRLGAEAAGGHWQLGIERGVWLGTYQLLVDRHDLGAHGVPAVGPAALGQGGVGELGSEMAVVDQCGQRAG